MPSRSVTVAKRVVRSSMTWSWMRNVAPSKDRTVSDDDPAAAASWWSGERRRSGLGAVVLLAAAALSLVSGVSSALVGVMVAVALLPPAAAVGLFLGQANWTAAEGSALLLGINIVCVNIAAKLVLLARGYRPRRYYEKARARRAMTRVLLGWVLTLVLLILLAYRL